MTSDRQTRGGQRFQQLGTDACTKLLSSLVEGGMAKTSPNPEYKGCSKNEGTHVFMPPHCARGSLGGWSPTHIYLKHDCSTEV